MCGTLASFMAMAVSGRELSAELSTFEILFFRSFIGFFIIAALLTKTGWGQVKTRRPALQIVRNIIHLGGQFGWFYAIALVTVSTGICH